MDNSSIIYQYWVAPFIEQFILENINLIDENCYKYLLENTYMQFSAPQAEVDDEDAKKL